MRVLWASHSAGLLGAERCLAEGVKGLTSKGVYVHVAVPHYGPLVPAIEAMHVPVSKVRYDWWMSRRGSWSLYHRARHGALNVIGWRNVLNLVHLVRPDLVVTNTLTIPIWALASKLFHIPHVWYIHEFFGEDHGLTFDWGNRLPPRLIDKLSSLVMVNSEAVRSKFQSVIGGDKLRIAQCAVEVPAALAKPDENHEDFSLAMLGAVLPSKGQEEAIRAVSLLTLRGLKVKLRIIGTNESRFARHLQQQAKDLHLQNSVEFIDFTDKPFKYVAAADATLMCSSNEAFGRVTVEAMKMGKPVIGAAAGGTKELIQDGVNGFLYESGNEYDLAEKISWLYHDHSTLVEMGSRAQAWATGRFTMERYTNDLLAIFKEAIERSGRTANSSSNVLELY